MEILTNPMMIHLGKVCEMAIANQDSEMRLSDLHIPETSSKKGIEPRTRSAGRNTTKDNDRRIDESNDSSKISM
jgi:hypothetical protein